MAKVELHSFVNPRRIEVYEESDGPSMTRQEFADECDINQIMARYEKNGIWPVQMGIAEPRYLDLTMTPDNLMDAMNQMQEASDAFMMLPASVRKEFDNDPVRFVEFATNRDNLGKLREWGLAEPEKAPDPPMRVEVVEKPEKVAGAPIPAKKGVEP